MNHDSNTTYRPWGSYTILDEGKGYKLKRIEVNPGQKISLQRHKHRSEHWTVMSGTAKVTKGMEELILRMHESVTISVTELHRLENIGHEPLKIIEIQMGNYLEEDDIERFDDIYGRK